MVTLSFLTRPFFKKSCEAPISISSSTQRLPLVVPHPFRSSPRSCAEVYPSLPLRRPWALSSFDICLRLVVICMCCFRAIYGFPSVRITPPLLAWHDGSRVSVPWLNELFSRRHYGSDRLIVSHLSMLARVLLKHCFPFSISRLAAEVVNAFVFHLEGLVDLPSFLLTTLFGGRKVCDHV